MGLERIELPAGGTPAARSCLAAALPRTDPVQLRATARRAGAIASELREAGAQLTTAADSAVWSGAAADAFRQRLRSSAPNAAATADRFDAYAQTLLNYAAAVDDAGPTLRSLSSRLADELSRTPPPATQPAVGGAAVIDVVALAAAQRQATAQDDALLALARAFAQAYNRWIDAVGQCVAGIRRANAADPTHDLHGWLAWEHRLGQVAGQVGHYVDPVLDFARHPSWRSASNSLSWLGSNFGLIAVAAFALCPAVAAVCLAVAAVLSVAQLAVDAWRRWGEGEQVSIASLIVDGLGAVPFGRVSEGTRTVATATRSGWGEAAGLRRLGGALGSAMPAASQVSRAVGHDLVHDPRELFAPGLRELPADYFRSSAYGGRAGLVRRWRGPLLWDTPNAVLGLPQVAGGTSTSQVMWGERDRFRRGLEQLTEPVDAAIDGFAGGLRGAVDPPR